MTVTVKHSKTNAISDWTQAQLDEQIELGNFAPGTTLADIVLPSDWNNDHTLTGVGTMAEQDANSVAITGGTINGTTIGATTASTGKFTSVTTPSVTATTNDLTLSATSTGAVKFSTAGGLQMQVADIASASRYIQVKGSSSGSPEIGVPTAGTLVLYGGNTSGIAFYSNAYAQQQFGITHTASAVNYVQVTGAATGNRPSISAQGSDTNIGLSFDAKGGPNIFFRSYGGANNQLKISGTNASVNNHVISGGASTIAPSLSVEGTDSNISMAFQPKGTGAIDLAAGSSGVNISNGGTVTAITRSAAGSGYTTVPSVAISAPTTAGGVTATATAQVVINGITNIANGGTGYTVGDVLTVSGGTAPSQTTQLTVATVSAGVITSVNITRFGTYTVTPTNPASVTGGTGSSATFNLNYAVQSGTFTITNAGSGYIEQPTVTFSGGGGSGAAAYASVGNTTTVKGLYGGASQIPIQFAGPSGNLLQIMESGNTSAPTPLVVKGGSSSTQLYANLSNSSIQFSSNGTGVINFYTNTLAQEQFRISHTASAVNYVQVTGGATTGSVVISSQGSDTNVGLQLRSKGTGDINLMTAGGTNQVVVRNVASAVNYLSLKGSAAGNMVPIQVEGTDTNIDLALTPKGTGLVRFGTYVAGALTATGYINIKAADGTTYKVLVST